MKMAKKLPKMPMYWIKWLKMSTSGRPDKKQQKWRDRSIGLVLPETFWPFFIDSFWLLLSGRPEVDILSHFIQYIGFYVHFIWSSRRWFGNFNFAKWLLWLNSFFNWAPQLQNLFKWTSYYVCVVINSGSRLLIGIEKKKTNGMKNGVPHLYTTIWSPPPHFGGLVTSLPLWTRD